MMRSKLKLVLLLSSLLLTFYVSLSYRYGDPSWRLRFREAEARGAYKLTDLSILNRTILYIKDKYVDPSRINERRMMAAAMKEVEDTVAELLVDVEEEDGAPTAINVRVGAAARRFELDELRSMWSLAFNLKDVFKFIEAELKHHRKIRDIEYAAINGVLSTLDPHSVLLKPEDYREMKLSTRGKFGGLGIVIGVRDGKLTVINPMEDTPASKAGLRGGDQIVRIGMDSTVNMSLGDAVDLLRGPPGTDVIIWVQREGWQKPRKYKLTRDDIRVKSVSHKALGGGIGWVQIKNFQNTTAEELKAALEKLGGKSPKRSKLKGLILDLRGNPGGLLDQAIRVSNLFIESGPLVTTVGSGEKFREPKMATKRGTQPRYPIVILTDALSASASEIVAGALRNHHRALLVGQQTFGKGSVQVIFDNKDDSALKLTIAQYLTPGDQSIQSVGVPPHVATQSVNLEADRSDLFARHDEYKEKNLKGHLQQRASEEGKPKAETPKLRLRYVEDPEVIKALEDKPDDLVEDFEVKLARRIITESKGADIEAMLRSAEGIVEASREAVAEQIKARLEGFEVDWREGRDPKHPKVRVEAEVEGGEVLAGEPIKLKLTVKNLSARPIHRLYAETKSESGALDGHEILIGRLEGKAERTLERVIKTRKSARSRRDDVRIFVKKPGSEAGEVVGEAKLDVGVKARPQPRFALQIYLDDGEDGDGALQVGEEAEVVVRVKNVSAHASESVLATIQADRENESRAVDLKRGRIKGEALAAGAEATYRFQIKAKGGTVPKAPLSFFVSVMDPDLRAATYTQIHIHPQTGPGRPGAWALEPARGEAFKLYGLLGSRRPIGEAKAAEADRKRGAWYRVRHEGVYAWAHADEVKVVDEVESAPKLLRDEDFLGPPVITLKRPSWETKRATLKLKGEATSDYKLKDLLIFANQKKIAFAPGGGHSIKFDQTIKLKKGVNLITVIAREDEQTSSRERLVIYRR